MKSKVCLTVEAKFNDLNFPENVLINFAKFTKKYLCRSLFFNNYQSQIFVQWVSTLTFSCFHENYGFRKKFSIHASGEIDFPQKKQLRYTIVISPDIFQELCSYPKSNVFSKNSTWMNILAGNTKYLKVLKCGNKTVYWTNTSQNQ